MVDSPNDDGSEHPKPDVFDDSNTSQQPAFSTIPMNWHDGLGMSDLHAASDTRMGIQLVEPWQYSHSLTHASSTSSLNSLTSSSHCLDNSLLVDAGMDHVEFPHSRQPSLEKNSDINLWTMPTFPSRTPLQIQTQNLGRSMNRTRSNSRVQPYYRERSASVSVYSEEGEDPADLQSTTSTFSCAPWSNPLVTPLNKMSLHHRRTSSNNSSKSSIRPILSRSHRSASLVLSKNTRLDLLNDATFASTTDEREASIEQKLAEKATGVRSAQPGSGQDKLRAAWVMQWLQLSYSHAVGFTVPRQGLYASYVRSSEEYGITAINAASFGKAVRNAYPGIKTRRLGNRGNSKYHYVSLRPATRIEVTRLHQLGVSGGQEHVTPENGTDVFDKGELLLEDSEGLDEADTDEEDVSMTIQKISPPEMRKLPSITSTTFLAVPVYNLDGFPTLDGIHLGDAMGTARLFWDSFCQHLEHLSHCMRQLQFDHFEVHCWSFWAQIGPLGMEVAQHPDVSLRIDEAFAKAYSLYTSTLIGRAFGPLPPSVQARLSSFGEHFQTVMEQSLQNFNSEFCESKVESAIRFAHLVKRFTSLYQLSAALSPIIGKLEEINIMIHGWTQLNDQLILDQCALSSDCNPEFLSTVLSGFSTWLTSCKQRVDAGSLSIEKLGQWIDGILSDLENGSELLVARVGFLTSQIVRDFTLRSDPAFGFFQLIKTWIDDWVILHVLRKSAFVTDSTETLHDVPEMSLVIPPPMVSHDLLTAVPYSVQDVNAVNSMWGFSPASFTQSNIVDQAPTPKA